MVFRDEMMDYKGKLRLALKLSGKGRYLTSKLLNIWMNRKERSKHTVVSLPLLIDKPSIKLILASNIY